MSTHVCARTRTLEGFIQNEKSTEGIDLPELIPGTVLTIRTHHSRYRLVILDGARGLVLIRGGSVFPEATPARIAGSTVGGNLLKVGWIGIGFRLEIASDDQLRRTSSVQSIDIEARFGAVQ